MPKSPKEEILRRYNICYGCEHFNESNSQCLLCGCNITKKKQFMNKLAWFDQSCPIEKW